MKKRRTCTCVFKRVVTEEEKEYYEERLRKQMEKYERDSKCGGVSCCGFVRLHDRYDC